MSATFAIRAGGKSPAGLLIIFIVFFLAWVAPTPVARAAQGVRPAEGVCPWCKNDPVLMKKAGIVAHDKMPFGRKTADDLRKFLTYATPRFIESNHFRIGSTLPGFSVPEKDSKRYQEELARLSKLLPSVKPKEKNIDPWLQLHLMAMRCEERYERFLGIIQMKSSDFTVREFGKPYHGEGIYLGMKEKFEVVLLRNQREFTDTLREQSGSTTKLTKRDHFVERGALSVFIPCDGDLKPDDQLWAHIAHNLGHNFVLGYKYFSYEPPKWFEEGMGHMFEKEVHDDFNSFDSEEAAVGEMTHARDWRQETLKIIDRGKAASLAELIQRKTLGDIGKEDHVIVWSKVCFMVEKFPDATAKFLDAVRGRLNAEGFPDGANLTGIQRDVFKEHLKLTFSEFDKEWEKWAKKTYVLKPAR